MRVRRRHWPHFKVKMLMAITAVFALIFYAFAEMSRISPEQRWDIEHEWVRNPRKARFLPSEGASVRSGDPLLKVAWITSEWTGHSWLVTDGGRIGDTWYFGSDAGGNRELGSAPAEGLAQLPAYLKRLPPSNLVAPAANSLIIVYPSGGVWIVRRYRQDSVPKEANDIARLLNFRNSLDGQPMDHW